MHSEDDYRLQYEMQDTILVTASTDSDTMYYYQAIQQPDRKQFFNTMIDELNEHICQTHVFWILYGL